MAFNAAMASPSPAAAANDVFKEHLGLRRSLSGQDLVVKAGGIRRSSSDNHLCSKNRIRAVSVRPGQGMKSSRSVGVFSFQISSSIIPSPIKTLLFETEDDKDSDEPEVEPNLDGAKKANWVQRLLEIRRQWKKETRTENGDVVSGHENVTCGCEDGEGCVADYENGDWERESFSKLLLKVSWSDAKQLSQLAYLCNVAYTIPEIKGEDLRRNYGLKFVTSSLEKKAKAALLREKLEQDSTRVPVVASHESESEKPQQRSSSSSAYNIAASAASYIHSCKEYDSSDLNNPYKSAAAAQAAASTMTAVVAAGEDEKLEAARELQSLQSSPCEWFVCDDPNSYTRCFVIQGSDSLASWKANLFFEPTKFEDTDVLVHRGIYEAAKGIYEQFLPEITEHLSLHGDKAKFQFTGHSLGGSLSLIVNLMLLSRGLVSSEAMKPVVTFGSPFVFCGGEKILEELGLDESHVHCVMMHRDIVPRAFSCNYPDHVALVLKRLNGSFRTHPCLNKNKLLYSPMGKVFILQPSESVSPTHPWLPPGNALYVLDTNKEGYSPTALRGFLNRPHPLETLSQRAAYGSEGSVLRDHDSKNYVKAVNGVIRQHTKVIVRKVRKQRRSTVWPVLTSAEPNSSVNDWNLTATEEIMTRA
ncbi:alpha/beta-Hydrolases superfamily protein [Raphanus sativus]|uniref:Phospholipase A1 PLIP1, chloroplastic-like n=1 Tax=Raphanus sativus TaxID=3726 RepID=A0A9W3DKF8_RAPSA|nr:phospholipase A1 PLIP1, chloroplastic-like [Raphanus sativus]KAJ4905243.1 alpha/beta-Hydrolases superfamily protein [Raphanus sativus]